jgi:predicted transcriptional regulator
LLTTAGPGSDNFPAVYAKKVENLIKLVKAPLKMQDIRNSLPIERFVNKNFPIIDSDISVRECVKRLNRRHEACIVTEQGYFYGVLGLDDILKGLINGDINKKIRDIKITKNYAIVGPDLDIFDIAELMKEESIEFVVVKNKDGFLGIVTKREMTLMESDLFDIIEKTHEN